MAQFLVHILFIVVSCPVLRGGKFTLLAEKYGVQKSKAIYSRYSSLSFSFDSVFWKVQIAFV